MTFAVTTLLAQGIYSGVINTISSLSSNIYESMGTLCKHKNPDVIRVLKKLERF